ncbi:MAG TPA: universal stress protein, partial [Acidimicrobiales bacterium]|nr:universal stress protein [Acidimicrobiales bacterium]
MGVDGTAGAQRALGWAARYAGLTGAEIVAAHILTYSREFARDLPPSGLSSWRARLRQELHGPWTQEVRDAGVLCRCVLIEH